MTITSGRKKLIPMASRLSPLLLLLFTLVPIHGEQIMLEDGYTVTTLLDGHKLNINPRAVQARMSDLVVLDFSKSVFYTLPFPTFQDIVMVKRLSGIGDRGYFDGEPAFAQFNKPKSFAVDLKGNLYVADRLNHAIRKISNSGMTTTIAGGCSKKPGRKDGPGKNATFSGDFELVFVPQICALLISDHGNQLIRQIDLKPEDCVMGSHSASDVIKFLGRGLSCILSLMIGIAIRPCVIIPHTGRVRNQTPSFRQNRKGLPNQPDESTTDEVLQHQKFS